MPEELKKDLGLLDVFCISSGAMISSGLFILPALAFQKAGPAILFSYVLAAFLVLPAMLSDAELATAMPKAGGTYFFIDRTFGPAFGTLGGISHWFSIGLKSAFALIGIGEFARLVRSDVSEIEVKLIAISCCLLFVLINIKGVRHAGKAQILMVLSLIGVLVFYVVAGLPHVDMARFSTLMPYGAVSIIATAGFVFVSYGGLTKVAAVAEEVRNPGRDIPLGLGLSLAVVTLLYALVIFVTVGVLDDKILMNSLTPLSIAASKFLGFPGLIILSVAAMLAFTTTANAGIMTASRDPLAMSRDGLLPKFFERVSLRFKTPHFSIIFTGTFMAASILVLNLEKLVKLASTLMILVFIFLNLSVIIMREARLANYKPAFKSPFYPWTQVAGIVSCFFLIVEMGVVPLFTATLFLTGGFVWYWVYGRPRVERESALICFIKRVAGKTFVCEDLGAELKEVLTRRDDIVEDRFHRLVNSSVILDLAEKMSADECFLKIADAMSAKVGVEAAALKDMLMQREGESSTALSLGLAIPHMVIEGAGVFELALIRSRDGIVFPGAREPVHAVFALFGSQDERNFHLRALMAIAQITQEKDFLKKWLEARSVEELRDLVLLGKRKRGE
ncbi:MAG: amino acid permease [Pseudomonadota bacterium]